MSKKNLKKTLFADIDEYEAEYVSVFDPKQNREIKIKVPPDDKCDCLKYWCNNCYFYNYQSWNAKNNL